jgi:hypothetical protein
MDFREIERARRGDATPTYPKMDSPFDCQHLYAYSLTIDPRLVPLNVDVYFIRSSIHGSFCCRLRIRQLTRVLQMKAQVDSQDVGYLNHCVRTVIHTLDSFFFTSSLVSYGNYLKDLCSSRTMISMELSTAKSFQMILVIAI